jgi:hypothetical protein
MQSVNPQSDRLVLQCTIGEWHHFALLIAGREIGCQKNQYLCGSQPTHNTNSDEKVEYPEFPLFLYRVYCCLLYCNPN